MRPGAAALGAILGLLRHLGVKVFHLDALGHVFLGVFIGGFLGLLVATIAKLVRHNKVKRRDELRLYMEKLNLSIDNIRQYAEAVPSADTKLTDLLNSL